jgi:hypothetical protein
VFPIVWDGFVWNGSIGEDFECDHSAWVRVSCVDDVWDVGFNASWRGPAFTVVNPTFSPFYFTGTFPDGVHCPGNMTVTVDEYP